LLDPRRLKDQTQNKQNAKNDNWVVIKVLEEFNSVSPMQDSSSHANDRKQAKGSEPSDHSHQGRIPDAFG
jgi:hypothetical protein